MTKFSLGTLTRRLGLSPRPARQRRLSQMTAAAVSADSLERRTMLAGTVTLGMSGNDLSLIGDGAANRVQVVVRGNSVEVSSLDGTTRIAGDNGNLDDDARDGVFSTVIGRRVDDVRVNLQGGDDVLSVFGRRIRVTGDIEIEGGRGDDTIAVKEVFANDDIEIEGGAGSDLISLLNSRAEDDVKIDLGGGDDAVSLARVRAGDDLRVKGRDGDDAVFMARVRVRDDVTVRTGDGQSLGLYASVKADDILIKGGDQTDGVIGIGLTSFDDLEIDTEGGDDVVAAIGTRVGDNGKIETDSGDDAVLLLSPTGLGDLEPLLNLAGVSADFDSDGDIDDDDGRLLGSDLRGVAGPIGGLLAGVIGFNLRPTAADDFKIVTDSGNDLIGVVGGGSYDDLDIDGESGFDRLLLTGRQRGDVDIDDIESRTGNLNNLPASVLNDLADRLDDAIPQVQGLLGALGTIPTAPVNAGGNGNGNGGDNGNGGNDDDMVASAAERIVSLIANSDIDSEADLIAAIPASIDPGLLASVAEVIDDVDIDSFDLSRAADRTRAVAVINDNFSTAEIADLLTLAQIALA